MKHAGGISQEYTPHARPGAMGGGLPERERRERWRERERERERERALTSVTS